MGSMRDFMRVRGSGEVVVEDQDQEKVMVKDQVEILKDQEQLGGGQDLVDLMVDQDLVKGLDQVGELAVNHYLVSEDQDPVVEVLKIKDLV